FAVLRIVLVNFLNLTHYRWLANGHIEESFIKIPQFFFLWGRLPRIKLAIIHPSLMMRNSNIIKDGGSTWLSKASIFSSGFSYFLPKVNHYRCSRDRS